MTWNPDAPLDLLNRASLVYVELMGHAAYCNWLEQELPRVKIYLNYKTSVIFAASTEAAATGAAPTSSPVAATPLIDEMVEVLRWYGDLKNYAMGGAILADGGMQARRVLTKYERGGGASKPNVIGTNTGHGHVWTRPDGVIAKCGGPSICSECKADNELALKAIW